MRLSIPASFAAAFGRFEGSDVRRRRVASIMQGLLTGVANRIVGVAVSLLSVPLTIGYLGSERYGVWTLISSLLAWLNLADLGIGNGLTNAIAGALGSERPDLVRAHVSTAFAVLAATALIMGAIIALFWPVIDWVHIFNVKTASAQSEIGPAMAAAIAIFLLSFPLSVISRTFNASQNGKVANYWAAAGNVLSLVALFVVTRTHGGLLLLVLAVSGTGLIVQFVSGFWLFTGFRPEFSPRLSSVQRASAREIMTVGVQFFFIQILALSIFQTDGLLVAHFLGATDVPAYSLTYKLFEFASLLQNIMFGYLWVAYAEAISRGDIDWVRKTFRRTLAFSLGSTLTAVIPLIFIAQPFIKIWTRGAITPPFDLVLWMAAWSMINALCSPIGCLLAAASQMKTQLVYGTAVAVTNLFLSVFLIQRWGVSGAIAGTVLAYVLFNCGPTILDVSLLIKRLTLEAHRKRTVSDQLVSEMAAVK
jgi:O-antigen/teichoic acid export membrane protein